MRIANTLPNNGGFTPLQGRSAPATGNDSQLQQQKKRYGRIHLRRSLGFWWYRILLVILGSILAIVLGDLVFTLPKETFGILVALPVLFLFVRRAEYGLFLTGFLATALIPKAVALKSLVIYPSIPFIFLLFFLLLVQTAFHVRKPVLPSFWVIWPQIGILVIVFASTFMGQLTWVHGVAHKVNSDPVIYDEIVGIIMFFIPLTTIITTSAALTNKDQWIEYLQRMFMIVALVCALITIIDFKRVGGDIYTYRFTEPSIGWMTLRALAQIIALGAMIAYARFLYATRWNTRILFGVCVVICLLAIYFSLQNSWWLEVGAALMVITIVYSRRLFLFLMIMALPLLPILKAELDKLQTVKSNDYYRLIIWQDALRIWRLRPWLGVGPGNFWAYDQRYTALPIGLHNCTKSGLCVAHEGYLQILGELGVIGLSFWLLMIAVLIFTATRLYQRSKLQEKPDRGFLGFIGLRLPAITQDKKDRRASKLRGLRRLWAIATDDDVPDYEVRKDRILGLVCLGLVFGCMTGDLFTSNFFLPPRQAYHTVQLPQVLTYWITFGCMIYKDQIWRTARRALKIQDKNIQAEMIETKSLDAVGGRKYV